MTKLAKAPSPVQLQLQERNQFLRERLEQTALRMQNNLMECALGESGYQTRMREAIGPTTSPRMVTPEYFAREAGWGQDFAFSMTADASDRYQGRNAPIFREEADLQAIRAIGRFYTEFDEVGLGLRENVVNYNAGEAISYVVEAKKKGQADSVVDALQDWVDDFLEQNKWRGLREKRPMRTAFSDGESLMILGMEEDLEFPDIKLDDCGHLVDPQNLSQRQTERLGFDYLDWTFGVGTVPGRPDRPKGYFFNWYGQDDYQLLPASRVVHAKLNVNEDVKRGVCDPFVAHTNLKRAAKGLGATAQQAAIQASIAYIEKMAAGTPAERVADSLNTPDIAIQAVINAMGGTTSRAVQDFMGGKIITTADKDFAYGPMGTPAGRHFVEVFAAVLRRVAVRWQFPEWMVSGDASNNNMASSIVAETPFHRGTRTRQGEWADIYETLIRKAVELAISVGRAPAGIPTDPRTLWKLVTIRAKMPDPKERDQLEETSIREIEHQNRVLSVKSWREQAGYDHETEEANFAEEDKADMARLEQQTAITEPPEPSPAAGGAGRASGRQQAMVKRANKKATAREALGDVQTFVEAARTADWDAQTRRGVAAAVIFDRSDDN